MAEKAKSKLERGSIERQRIAQQRKRTDKEAERWKTAEENVAALQKEYSREERDQKEATLTFGGGYGSGPEDRRVRPEKLARFILEDNTGQLRGAFSIKTSAFTTSVAVLKKERTGLEDR